MDRRELLKRFLAQYKNAHKRRRTLEARLRDLQMDINMPLKGVRYSDMPHGSGISDGAATLAIRKADLEDKIQKQNELVINIMTEVMMVIEYLPSISDERQIIENKYIDDYSWNRISREIGYSRSSCFDKFNKGLDKLIGFDGVKEILNEYEKRIV